MESVVLQVENLSKSFGGVHALSELSLEVRAGEILGLIGPNGSGKSTAVNVLAGVYPSTAGRIKLQDREIQKMPEYQRVEEGICRTFQTASIFPEFTVREQIQLGCNVTLKTHPASSIIGIGRDSGEERSVTDRVEKILKTTGLDAVADNRIDTISSAQQRFLMIATAFASQPKVLLLDEPAAGMISHERATLGELILAIRNLGVSVLVIEHHMALIMDVCDRIVVLNFGSKIAEGSPEEIRNNQAVIDAYLGKAA